MNVSEQLLEILTSEGVKHIFGVAGDALNPLVEALGKQDTIKWIKVKHEGNGAYAAFAQGELGANFGVCASTVGPGALHLVNGLYNAKKERSPVIAITGQIPLGHMGTNYHQEVDLTKVFDDICEYQAIIRSPEEAPRVILRAIRIAVNRQAVCRIELPADIAEMPAANTDFVHPVFRSDSHIAPSLASLEEAASLINSAENIGILAGAGCRKAVKEVLDFADFLKAPITHTVRAADIFDHDKPQVVGLTGLIGNPSGYKTVMECELLILLGTDFPYTNFLPSNTKTLQIDIRAENIGNRTPVDCGLHADLKQVLPQLSGLLRERKREDFMQQRVGEFSKWKASMASEADPSNAIEPLHPQLIAKAISDLAADDAIFVIDTGTAAIWSTNYMNFKKDRRVIGSFNHGSMAVGLPAAIGAQLMYPEREVWALMGDGAFNMCLNDFSTAVEYELPVKIVVFNNSELGFVKIEMEEAGLAPNFDALELENFNFSEFARLTGGQGFRVEKAKEVYDTLERARRLKKPTVIDAVVNSGELSLPPKIGFEEARKFGTSKIKEVVEALKGDQRQWENIKKEVSAYFDKKF